MHHTLSTTYILPAIFLNPILFLHSVNTILSRILPPNAVDAADQPPPYWPLGPSAKHPHLDIHASDRLCWAYTVFMVTLQLMLFGTVRLRREEGREKARRKEERALANHSKDAYQSSNAMNGKTMKPNGPINVHTKFACRDLHKCKREESPDPYIAEMQSEQWDGSNDDDLGDTTDSETML